MTSTPKAEAAMAPSPSLATTSGAKDNGSKDKMSFGTKVKPATYDGSGNWLDYKAHFDVCAELNDWSDKQKGMYLAVSLRGQAQGVFGNIRNKSYEYTDLVKALEERFAPPNQNELYRVQLRERRQKAAETLSELGQDIRRLTNLAYPTAPQDLRETLAKEQFLDALVSSDMRLRIKQARPVDLNDAVRHAVELEAFNRAERKHNEGQGYMRTTSEKASGTKPCLEEDLKALRQTVSELTRSMESLKQQKPSTRSFASDSNASLSKQNKRKCFKCGSEEHLIYNCPKNQKTASETSEDKNHQAKSVAGISSGLYAECKISNYETECLIDTGATLSIISCKAWDTINQSGSVLQPFNSVVYTASGGEVDIKGKTPVSVEVCGIQCIIDMIVANIDIDVILGLDFLKTHNCQIDVNKQTLKLRNKTCNLKLTGKLGCYRVTVSKTIEIPSRSELIVEGTVSTPVLRQSDLGIIEPTEKSYQTGRGLVAKALIHASNKVPIRMINLSNETEKIYSGTHVANLSFVAKVKEVKSEAREIPVSKQVPEHLQDLYQRTIQGLSNEQCSQIAKLLIKHESTFSENDEDLGRTGIIRHKIPTGNARPIKQPLRRLPVHMHTEADKQIDEMLRKDVIQKSSSPWASGIVMVEKKDGSKRFCVDYRRLNDITIKDAYPLPRIDDSLDQLSGAQWFSCLDLNSGYWQVEVEESDRPKTAFASKRGLFEFKVMPFGLCNAPATFERLMETVLAGLNWQICLIYLDDIIIFGKTFEDMINNLDKVLNQLKSAGLKLKPRKCQLFAKEVEFLGHMITSEGIKTDPKKTKAVREWPTPENIHQVRSFLGFCSYYRRFIPRFAEVAKPLHRLSEKGQAFVWSEQCDDAFKMLKSKMADSPVLAHPDFQEPFILDTDASDMAIGAVLSQKLNGQEYVIAYASRTLTKSERRYCVTRKELLALVHFVKYFRHYLYGKTFTIRTDHGSLRWLMKFKNPEGQLARWLEVLSSYSMKIEHRPGRLHGNADGLSRIPCKQCGRREQRSEKEHHEHVSHIFSVDACDEVTDIGLSQDSDPEIRLLKSWIKEETRPAFKDIASCSYFVKSLWSQWERLELIDEILVRKWEVLGTDIIYWQAVIPLKQRRLVLKYSHDIKASGHLGVTKTLKRIRQRYYWPGLQRDVRAYVVGCEKCAKRKGPNRTKIAPMQIVRSGYPMERIAVDILGELPRTENGNKYILVVGDYFTKWTECFPMPNMEAVTVARILVNEVFSRFGIPGKIHSDQGRQFESNLFQEMCRILQIEKTRTTAYHPQSDGMVERFNRTLTAMLSAFVSDHHTDWDEQLPIVMMAYRSAEHETTGQTPNMLMFGRETTTPLDILYEMPPAIKEIPANWWVWEIQERLESAHTLVRQHTGKAMNRQKNYHDMKLSYEVFEPGDDVYVYVPVKKVGCSSKFTSFWRGPYQVLQKLSDVLYKVNSGRSETEQIIHCDRLRKARKQVLAGEASGNELSKEDSVIVTENSEIKDVRGNDFDTVDTEVPSEVDDSDAEEEQDTGIIPLYKRVRRKPVWAKDYVMSCFRCNMPNTKQTPRKQPDRSGESMNNIICPVCKEVLDSEQNFATHVQNCFESRVACDTCGQTFKKRLYLVRHQKKYHPDLETITVSSESLESGSSHIAKKPQKKETDDKNSDLEVSESDSEESMKADSLGEDPEIEIECDIRSSKELECDTRTIRDITSGRVVRKATTPMPVIAPKKVKIAQATDEQSLDRLPTMKAPKSEMLEKDDSKIQGKDDSEIQGKDVDRNVQHTAEVTIEISKKKFVSNEIMIKDDGERLFSSFSINKTDDQRKEPDINLGEFLSHNATLKARDIVIKRAVSAEGGKVILSFNYHQE